MIKLALQSMYDNKQIVRGYEVLARMICSEHGLVGPVDFMRRTGMCWKDLDVEVFSLILSERSLRQVDVPLFLNISPETLLDVEVISLCCELLKDIVARFRCEIVVEIPEASALSGVDLERVLKMIEAAGAKLAIDDFGTLFADIDRLEYHSWDYCKLDLESLKTTETLDWVVGLKEKCAARKIQIVCERLERVSDLDLLKILPDAWIQGFAFSPPIVHPAVGIHPSLLLKNVPFCNEVA